MKEKKKAWKLRGLSFNSRGKDGFPTKQDLKVIHSFHKEEEAGNDKYDRIKKKQRDDLKERETRRRERRRKRQLTASRYGHACFYELNQKAPAPNRKHKERGEVLQD